MAESAQLRQMRAAFDAWNRGDVEGTLRYHRDDVVWRTSGLMPGIATTYEGKDGVRRFFREFSEPWETISITLEDVIDERESQLFVVARFRAKGREGIEVDMPFFHIYRFDDQGLLKEFTSFVDEQEARRAAGLP